MLDERKAAILSAIVSQYIQTAQPVGSGLVARASGLAISSATVRNEMAVLEQEGYLHQPHTSAGRVPTDKGYRFFVDSITGTGRLDDSRAQQVRSFFSNAHGALERMLHDTSKLLSDLTDYAAVVVGPSHEQSLVHSVQLVGLGGHHVVVIAVLSDGEVERRSLELDEEWSAEALTEMSARLSRLFTGHGLASLPAVVASDRPETDRLAEVVRDALCDSGASDVEAVYVGGASRMAVAFDAVDVVRQVLLTLEQQYVVVSLLQDVLSRGLSVAIGSEHGVEPLAACSVVVAPLAVDGEMVGSIGVLGPTRMNYPQALAAVSVVSERLGRRLSEG